MGFRKYFKNQNQTPSPSPHTWILITLYLVQGCMTPCLLNKVVPSFIKHVGMNQCRFTGQVKKGRPMFRIKRYALAKALHFQFGTKDWEVLCHSKFSEVPRKMTGKRKNNAAVKKGTLIEKFGTFKYRSLETKPMTYLTPVNRRRAKKGNTSPITTMLSPIRVPVNQMAPKMTIMQKFFRAVISTYQKCKALKPKRCNRGKARKEAGRGRTLDSKWELQIDSHRFKGCLKCDSPDHSTFRCKDSTQQTEEQCGNVKIKENCNRAVNERGADVIEDTLA